MGFRAFPVTVENDHIGPAITTIIVMDIAHFSTRVLLMSAEILMKRKNQGTSWGGLRGDFGGFFVFWREYAKTKMGSEGRLWAAHSRRWGRRGDFGFRVFPVIPLLLETNTNMLYMVMKMFYMLSFYVPFFITSLLIASKIYMLTFHSIWSTPKLST